jgi:uncharacterized membrane protein (DUF106 family)
MPLRLICTLFLLVSVAAFPLYFTLAVGIFSVIWFRRYYELIPLYFLNDVLYGVPLLRFASFPYVMTILAIVLVVVCSLFRAHTRAASLGKI